MDHIYPGVFEPVSAVIENLIRFPSICAQRAEKRETHSVPKPCRKESAAYSDPAYRGCGHIRLIPTERIVIPPDRPARSFDPAALSALTDSIRQNGILQPLVLREKRDTDASEPSFTLLSGARRLAAAKDAGLAVVPCIIFEADAGRSAEVALFEALQREDLDMFEQAGALASLLDLHMMTQEQLAKSLSVSQSWIANKLRILRLTSEERERILHASLSERHARAFLRIRDLDRRKEVVRLAAEGGWPVAKTEEYIDGLQELLSDPARSADPVHREEKIAVRDAGIVYNTIENAVRTVQSAGIPVTSEREECAEGVRYVIVVPKP